MGPSSRRRSTQTANREKTERPSGENSKRFDPNDYVLPKSTTIIASVVLHAPGLSCVYYFNDSISVFFSAIVGSICEGVFFYLMLALLLKIYRQRAHAPKTRASKLGYWRDTFYRLPITLGIFLLLNALLVFPMGDYFLQNKSDGFTDFNVVASAFREASMMLTWVGKGQDRINDILQYVLVSFAAFGLSLMTFGYGVHLSASGKCRKKQCWNTNKRNVLNSGILTAIVYATGTWSPVFHCSVTMAVVLAVQVVGTNQPLITKFDNVRLSREIIQQAKMAPNVILLIHDSVSGPALLNTKEGKSATPFFRSLLEDDDMYLFRNGRAVGGTTLEGWTSIATGCLPFTKKGRNMALESWIGSEFKRKGRHTSGFCSWKHGDENSGGSMIMNYMGSMDLFVDPFDFGHELVNSDAADDRLYIPMIKNWIQHNVSRSFFSNIYTMNTHYPFVRDGNSSFPEDPKYRYFSSLETFDDYMRKLFESLKETGQLENTIIIGSADHGNTYLRSKPFARMIQWDPKTLNIVPYMYIPKKLFPSFEARQTLVDNLNKTVSTLDLFPTMQHILYGGSAEATAEARKANNAIDIHGEAFKENCITGFDLLGESVPENRLAISWNVIHKPNSNPLLAAISNSERGFYIRQGWPRRNGVFELNFNPACTSEWTNTCVEEATTDSKIFWRKKIKELYNSSELSKSVLQSKFMSEMQKKLDNV